jgi:integrase
LNRHLTDAVARRLPAPKQGNAVTWDDTVAGFGCRVTSAGSRAFVLNYRVKGSGRERRITIGGFPDWTVAMARKRARELRRQVNEGSDPLGDIEADRSAATMAELCDRFEAEHLTRRRPGTAADYRSMLVTHIRPHFKDLKVAAVMHNDVVRLHDRITAAGHPYRANRVIAVLSKMFGLAQRWGMRDDNPAKGIEKNTEHQRRRYLKSEELAALTKALAAHSDRQTANVIRLLLLTGARRGEVLSMRWADIDLSAGLWSKPASSTKQNKPHEVPLSAPARQLLAEIRDGLGKDHRGLPEFVFAGNGARRHVVEIKRVWRRLCKAAGLKELRIHDLRHSFASELASGGASLPLIGALLGHSNPTTTARYAHLFQDPQRAAVERVGAIITGRSAAELMPLPKRRR